jgi:hypothetical protein
MHQIQAMILHDLQEAVVLNLPEGLVGLVFDKESEIREQLAEADIRRQLLKVGELGDQLVLGRRFHGTKL